MNDALKVVEFYRLIIFASQSTLFSCTLIALGAFTRALQIFVFVFILKALISIVQPETLMPFYSEIISQSGVALSPTARSLGYLLTGIAGVFVILQYGLGRLYTSLFVKLRLRLINRLILLRPCENQELNQNLVFDRFPQGFEAAVKSSEIIVFYVFLFFSIALISMEFLLIIIFLVPVVVVSAVYVNRKEVHFQSSLWASRKQISNGGDDEEFLNSLNRMFVVNRNNIVNPELLGGLAFLGMMLALLLIDIESLDSFRSLVVLFLVFCARFAIIFAGDLSRALSKLFGLRVIIEKIDIKKLGSSQNEGFTSNVSKPKRS